MFFPCNSKLDSDETIHGGLVSSVLGIQWATLVQHELLPLFLQKHVKDEWMNCTKYFCTSP